MTRQEGIGPNGAAAAAIMAAGIGSAIMGLMTILAEASDRIAGLLNLYDPVGPLSGKVTIALLVWLVAWRGLHAGWKDRDLDFGRVWKGALVLVILGFVGTFPSFFDLFGR